MGLLVFALIGFGSWITGAIVLALFVGTVIKMRNNNGRKNVNRNNIGRN